MKTICFTKINKTLNKVLAVFLVALTVLMSIPTLNIFAYDKCMHYRGKGTIYCSRCGIPYYNIPWYIYEDNEYEISENVVVETNTATCVSFEPLKDGYYSVIFNEHGSNTSNFNVYLYDEDMNLLISLNNNGTKEVKVSYWFDARANYYMYIEYESAYNTGAFTVKAVVDDVTDLSDFDIVEYGSYPQSKVTDKTLLSSLNAISLTWFSYEYYFDNNVSNYMQYADVNFNGEKYRAVKMNKYKPSTTSSNKEGNAQSYNGYEKNTIYWFKYEPIEWFYINTTDGLLICKDIIDSQSLNNWTFKTVNNETQYGSNYSNTSIRKWLNEDFFQTAFNEEEQNNIIVTTLDNGEFEKTQDKVFVLSKDEIMNSQFGFYEYYDMAAYLKTGKDDRAAETTEYAECLGVYCSKYWVRTVATLSMGTNYLINSAGSLFDDTPTSQDVGVRPALITNAFDNCIIQYDANGGTGAPANQTKKRDSNITLSSTIPTRLGYTFLGWSTKSNSSTATYIPGATFSINTDTTLYAVWKQTTISDGSAVTTPITYAGQTYYYKFTPSSNGKYVIYSTGSEDTRVYLYDANGTQISSNDDGGEGQNFKLEYDLTAGDTYYYGVKYYSSTKTGSISVDFKNVDTGKPTGKISSTNNVASSQTVTLTLSDNVGVAGYYWGTSSSYSSNTYAATSSSSVTKKISSSGTYYLTVKDTSGNISETKSVTFYKTTLDANGGSVSPTSVLTASGNSFTFPTPTRSGYVYSGWSESSSATNGTITLKPTISSTYYAVWTYNDITKPTGTISSTNNVASSQTVTLTLSDNVGVAGYYWGTSSSYTGNTYTETSSSSVKKTVSSSGTYYLTVKDTSGNISDPVSIKFYKTTLDANDGSVSPTSVLTASGNSFTFPTPTRNGYTCVGWSTASGSTSGVTTLKPNEDKTYYAIWKDTTKPTGNISCTNNVESRQMVTLTMNDNVRIMGYYWGTNSSYLSNAYTATSSSSVTKTISSSGTYYLTVKDTSGNLSEPKIITFYQTTLDANGGSVSPKSILTKSGNSFTFPTPAKSGCTYKGWSTSKSVTNGVTTLEPKGNTTYYALWEYDDIVKPTGSIASTNNVETSQTVTLTLSDNVGVAGYYWGTSSSYTGNTYTETSSSSVKKTVSSSGTYYLTVKDTSGNISDPVSIKFYKTTLDANGGSVSPTSVLISDGNSFTFPNPIRSGYACVGWSTSKSATSGVTTVKPTGNTTYYALWKKFTLLNQSDIYSFSNSKDDFFYEGDEEKYYISDSDLLHLTQCVKNKYGANIHRANMVISACTGLINSSEWGGSCFGMAATTMLDKLGYIAFNETFSSNADTMHDVEKPKDNSRVESAINYYFAAQSIEFIMDKMKYAELDISSSNQILEDIVSDAKSGNLIMFNYRFFSEIIDKETKEPKIVKKGHAIVVTGFEVESNGNYKLYTYDNRVPNEESYIIIDPQYKQCTVISSQGYEVATEVQYTSDMSIFEPINISKETKSYEVKNISEDLTKLSIGGNDIVTIYNENGEYLNFNKGKLSGTMKVYSKYFTVSSSENSNDVSYVLKVDNSESFSFDSNCENMCVSVLSDNIYACTKTQNADAVVIAENEGVYTVGENTEFDIILSAKNNYMDTIILSGTNDSDFSLLFVDEGIHASGVYGNYELTVLHDIVESEKITFDTDYKDIVITGEKNGTYGLDVKYSSGNNGKFDSSLLYDDNVDEDDANQDIVKNCECKCHKKGIANVFFKIILFFQKIFRLNKICKCGTNHY